jgi:hypothetical protein
VSQNEILVVALKRVVAYLPTMQRLMRASVLIVVSVLASHDEFLTHMRAQRRDASPRRAAALPAAAAPPVLHFNPALFADEDLEVHRAQEAPGGSQEAVGGEAVYGAMLAHEEKARAAAPHAEFPYVLCGPQPHAKDARAAIAAVTGLTRTPVRKRHSPNMCGEQLTPHPPISVYVERQEFTGGVCVACRRRGVLVRVAHSFGGGLAGKRRFVLLRLARAGRGQARPGAPARSRRRLFT